MSARSLRFYYDFISPYAFLGWRQVRPFARDHGLELELVPVLFAAMLNHHGTKGPAEIAPKRVHTWKNVVRVAAAASIDIRPPEAHPFNPLLALRLATAAETFGEREALTDALYDLIWGGGAQVPTENAIRAQLGERGMDADAWLVRTRSSEVKDQLKTSTEEAIRRGVFGVPSFEVEGEVFWGQDSLPHLEVFLEGRDPAAHPDVQRWLDMPVGVTR